MKNTFFKAILLATVLWHSSCSSSITSGPGDPALTYERMMKNVNSFKGKRVHWYGRNVTSESKNGVIYAPFLSINGQKVDDIQNFFVEPSTEKEYAEMPKDGWVTGTIVSTHTLKVTQINVPGETTESSKEVPLLRYVSVKESDDK